LLQNVGCVCEILPFTSRLRSATAWQAVLCPWQGERRNYAAELTHYGTALTAFTLPNCS